MLLVIVPLYRTKKNFSTSDITNTITRHNHNKYEHNAINKIHKHINHIYNYDAEINYYSKKSFNKKHIAISIMIILILNKLGTYY